MEKMIEISGLKKSFGSLEVLSDIDLILEKGDNLAILGRSGIGKSVLTKCIVGLIEPDEGTIFVLGQEIGKMEYDDLNELRTRIGYLFQGGALYDSMSVKENLIFPMRKKKKLISKGELQDRVEEVLENVGLSEAIDKMPSELSGGMRKRIALARTLIKRPEIIFYDEPTTGLDPVTSGEISDLIVSVSEKYDTSSIIVTHDMKCARITASYLKLLEDGIFYAEGTYDEMASNEDLKVSSFFH
ncbi:MAG TPA: ATP-binding cassette domain-containing protein [Bacteroidales bacterium]|nr:ATP-binding cassette domain-containing protein [Bacteroidales bacterium]